MTEIQLPLSITYQTHGPISVEDVIAALQATEALSKDAISLLPSLIDGLQVEDSSLNVLAIQQGSLREAFFIALLVTYQGDLSEEVPPVIEELLGVTVSDKYDTIATVAFLTVLFYGAGLAVNVVQKAFVDSLPRAKLDELIQLLALETGKSADEIRKVIEARFQKPAAVKRIVKEAKRFFRPSKKDGNAAVLFDRDLIGKDTVAQVPLESPNDNDQDFDRYVPVSGAVLELHAQDRDRSATGWAAIAPEISDKRLKVRVVDPVQPSDLWQKDEIVADVVVVSKLTSDGYAPWELQVTRIVQSQP